MKRPGSWPFLLLGAIVAGTSAQAGPPASCEATLPEYRRPIQASVDDACRATLWSRFPEFTTTLCPTIPDDVSSSLYQGLMGERARPEGLAHLNRLFDIFSWQTFIALSWPVDDREIPRETLTSEGEPWFMRWKNASEVFREDGSRPPPWEAPDLPLQLEEGVFESALPALTPQDTSQPDKHDLVDQNGNKVYFEILINRPLFDYLYDNKLYNLDGQLRFFQCLKEKGKGTLSGADLPWGTDSESGRRSVGAIAIKLAWKILDPEKGDVPERFIRREAEVIDAQGMRVKKTFGLVGMNMMRKTFRTRARWTWVAFEHVDNLQVNELEKGPLTGGKPRKPLFHDPECPTCPVNVPPDPRVPQSCPRRSCA